MDKIRSHLFVISLSATGMLFGHWLAGHLPELSPSAAAEQASAPQVVSAHALEVVGADGRRQILMGPSGEGAPATWPSDKNANARTRIGLQRAHNPRAVQ